MGYFKRIRKSFESIFASRGESSINVQEQQQPAHRRNELQFTTRTHKRRKPRDIMPGSSRLSPSSSDKCGGRIENGEYSNHTPGTARYDRGATIIGDGMLPTPLTASLKRKRDVEDTEYNDRADGSALISGARAGKRVCVSADSQPLTPISSPLGVHEGTGIESKEVYTELKCDNSISSQSDCYEQDTNEDSLSYIDESDESISELSSESSLSDSDEDVTLSLPVQHLTGARELRSRRRGEPKATSLSPEVIVKSSSNCITLGDAQASDLSDDDFPSQKINVRKQSRKETTFGLSVEKTNRCAAAVQIPPGLWADAERDLILRLSMRGLEPMLPSNWRMDFPTLPDSLFAVPGSDDGLLLPSSSSEFRAIRYFNNLLLLTGRVRDRLVCRLRPERMVHYAIKSYLEWALRDAIQRLRANPIPLFSIYSLKPSQSTSEAVRIINRRLVCLANRHRDILRLNTSIEIDPESDDHVLDISQMYADRTYPVLTGFVICGSIVAIITLNSDPKINPILNSKNSGKFIAQLDLSESGQGVWNALAIAITAVRVQKTLRELEEGGGGVFCSAEPHVSVDADI